MARTFSLLVWLSGWLLATSGFAQEIKVDFNANNRPLAEGWDTAYTPWATNNIWFPGGDVIANTFSGVTFTFRRVGPTGTALLTDRYPAGLTTAGWTAKLVSDGITVNPHNITNIVGVTTTAPARIELTISNLSAGPHTLLTWHNTWQNPASFSFSPLNIYLNGTQVITNLPVSNRVTNNIDGAYSYIEFTAVSNQDVVVAYEASTNFTVTDCNVCIDGFEIDTPNIKYKANTPTPANGDEHVNADGTRSVNLTWKKAALALTNRVYFGNNRTAVFNATTNSPEYKGAMTATNYLVTNVSSLVTNYWRIDEVDATGGVTRGDVWYFRTRHLAFPGAEGYGRFARGGRGGVVVEVTNTNDSGAGSLRDALLGNYGPRTVVFTVSGLIQLETDVIININTPYITLAGQTAPGKGICTRKQQLGMSGGRDVIFRNVRSRPGNLSGTTLNGTGMAGSDHCIMDHVSVSWGIDEELSTRTSKNVTFQRSLISEALNIAGHQNYPAGYRHGLAATIGGDVGSFHHNLLAHCEGRNWSMGGGLDASGNFAGRLDIFNNVVYNWRSRATEGGAHEVNFVGNYYKPGAASTITFYALEAQYGNFPGTQQYYFAGNVMPGHFDESNQEAGRTASTEGGGSLPTTYSPWVSNAFFPSFATIHTATNAYKLVMSDVGCNQPQIDDHDVRVIRETIDGTYTYTGTGPYGGSPGLPNSQDDVGGWEDYPYVQRPANFDSDHDGLPDWWETLKGTNPNSTPGDFSDSNGDPDGDEYTNLEDYLNWMASLHFDCTNGVPLDIDLYRFTRGFTNTSPVYTVSLATNGAVTLLGDGHTARFTGNSTTSLASFRFSVTDSQGSSMTNEIGLRVVSGVASSNTAPTLPAISNRTINIGISLAITNTATDADGNGLTYTLPVAPTNAAIGASSGVLTWRPLVNQGGSTNPFTVVVTDNGTPNLSATQSFSVVVNPLTAPAVSALTYSNNLFNFTVNGQSGPAYALESSLNLSNWTTLLITNSPPVPFNWNMTITTNNPVKFFRIKTGPPLP